MISLPVFAGFFLILVYICLHSWLPLSVLVGLDKQHSAQNCSVNSDLTAFTVWRFLSIHGLLPVDGWLPTLTSCDSQSGHTASVASLWGTFPHTAELHDSGAPNPVSEVPATEPSTRHKSHQAGWQQACELPKLLSNPWSAILY